MHPLSLGTGGHTYTLMVKRFLETMDFGLGIGTSFTRNTFTTPMPEGIPLGQVTNCAEDMGKDFEIAVGALGDAKLVLRQMIEEAKRQIGEDGRENDAVDRVAAVSRASLPLSGNRILRPMKFRSVLIG